MRVALLMVMSTVLILFNLFYAFGTGWRLVRFGQDPKARQQDLFILCYLLFQCFTITALWLMTSGS